MIVVARKKLPVAAAGHQRRAGAGRHAREAVILPIEAQAGVIVGAAAP